MPTGSSTVETNSRRRCRSGSDWPPWSWPSARLSSARGSATPASRSAAENAGSATAVMIRSSTSSPAILKLSRNSCRGRIASPPCIA